MKRTNQHIKIKNELLSIFNEGINAVQPSKLIPQYIHQTDTTLTIKEKTYSIAAIGKVKVLALGKAAAAMAAATEIAIGNLITDGLCVTKYNHAIPLAKFTKIEAGHPTPDENSLLAANKVIEFVTDLSKKDVLIILLSGGASALVTDLPNTISLDELKLVYTLLVNSSATIKQINIVRKHLSKLKGGQLAMLAQPAQIHTLIISDVADDDLSSIASGFTTYDDSTYEMAIAICKQFNIYEKIPSSAKQYLSAGHEGIHPETIKRASRSLKNQQLSIIGNNQQALLAAQHKADQLGYQVYTHPYLLTGSTTATTHILIEHIQKARLTYTKKCLLFGAETVVENLNSNYANAKGGRNQHLALQMLAVLQALNLQETIFFFSGATDGTDGATDAAGAVVDNKMLLPIETINHHLANFEGYHFFEQYDLLVKTNPTQTNVMDLIVIIICPN